MKAIKHYSQEIYTVLSLLLLTISAIFITPDLAQKLVLAYVLLFLLHEWEEGVYPGGFVDMMMGEIINAGHLSTKEQQKESRIYIDLLLLILTFTPFFAHTYFWLVLPCVYLGLLEGFVHTASIKIFKLDRSYTPGMVTAICQFILSAAALAYIIKTHRVIAWQYPVAFLILLVLFICAQSQVAAANGLEYKNMPKMIRNNLKTVRNKK